MLRRLSEMSDVDKSERQKRQRDNARYRLRKESAIDNCMICYGSDGLTEAYKAKLRKEGYTLL